MTREPGQTAPSATETPDDGLSDQPVTQRPDESPQERQDDEEKLRDRLEDLLPRDMVIWDDDEELDNVGERDRSWWLDILGHTKLHAGCCKTCGCASTCMAGAFHGSIVTSVLRELDRLGALREPAITEGDRDA